MAPSRLLIPHRKMILLLLLLPLSSARDCYSLDGVANSGISPCNASAQGTDNSHSACCNADFYDACLSSGLCFSTGYWNGRFPGEVWADGCTDPTGKDPACPQVSSICGPNDERYHQYYFLPCGNSTVCCCGYSDTVRTCNFTTCCRERAVPYPPNFRFGIVTSQLQPTGVGTEPPGTSSGTTDGLGMTPSTSAGNAGTSDSQQSMALPIVGAVLGAVVFIALGAAIYLFFKLKRRVGKDSITSEQPGGNPAKSVQPILGAGYADGAGEMRGPTELPPDAVRFVELPGSRRA